MKIKTKIEVKDYPEPIKALIPAYYYKRVGEITAIRKMIREKDLKKLSFHFFKVKGSCSSFALDGLSVPATHVYEYAEQGDIIGLRAAYKNYLAALYCSFDVVVQYTGYMEPAFDMSSFLEV